MYKKLFEPYKIKKNHIKNRIVFPAFNTSYATEKGFVTPRLINFHKNVKEVGINIVGATSVSEEGRVNFKSLRIDGNKYIPSLRKLFSTITDQGSIPTIQLTHAGSQTSSAVIGSTPVAPSSISAYSFTETPRELSSDEINRIIIDFTNASKRAIKAGAKAIELHAAHGYLIHQFLSPCSNKRGDAYGGSLEKRMRFLKEILNDMRDAIGNDILLLCRISADEFLHGGITIDDSIIISKEIEKSGADMIDVSAGIYGQRDILYPTTIQYHKIRITLASKIKKKITIPVICSGYISNLYQAEKLLKKDKANFIALGRALIADPLLIKKSIENGVDTINKCLWCNKCVYDWQSRKVLTCPQNSKL